MAETQRGTTKSIDPRASSIKCVSYHGTIVFIFFVIYLCGLFKFELRVEYNVQRAINTLSGSVDKCMLDSTNKISSTARNIDRWRADMFQGLVNIRNEIDLLLLSKQKILKAQTALGVICSISTECLERRSFRLNMDLTLDPGQVELIKVSY